MATIEKRVADDGTVTFRTKVRLKGYPTQTASFNRITDAKKWASQTEADIRAGRHFKTVEAKKHTAADLIDRYIRHELPKKGSQAANQKTQLLWWREAIGPFALTAVTPALLAEHRDILANEPTKQSAVRSPSTVNRYLAALSHAFTVAVREWGWMDENPLRKVSKPSEAAGRTRFLDDDERTRLFDACKKSREPLLYPCVLLAISTGMRQSEILNLHWKMPSNPPKNGAWGVVHLDQSKIILHQTKNKEKRVVPLVGSAARELATMVRTEGTTMVFPSSVPGKPINMRESFTSALGRAEIGNFRFHDLRHSCASYLAMNGASLAEIAEILGHKTLEMVKRYSHLSDSHVAGVLESMNRRVLG